MISILGTLKGMTQKSKVGDDNRIIHTVSFTLELTEGVEAIPDIVENLKQIVEVRVDPRQPHLGMG